MAVVMIAVVMIAVEVVIVVGIRNVVVESVPPHLTRRLRVKG